jgi:large subunit ribosomal protein L9
MEVLLIQDVPGIGKKNDLLVVGDGFALNYLLPKRAALVATPLVRKRYAEFIRRRAEEREKEKAVATGAAQALAGKSVVFKRKVSKNGKLFGSITEKNVADALKEQHDIVVSEDGIRIDDAIKTIGTHQIMMQMGEQVVTVNVTVEAEKE